MKYGRIIAPMARGFCNMFPGFGHFVKFFGTLGLGALVIKDLIGST